MSGTKRKRQKREEAPVGPAPGVVGGEVEVRRLDAYAPNDWNPNEMEPEEFEQLRATMREKGWARSEALLVWASYGFAYHGVAAKGWHAYRKALVLEQARKNFARVNKVFMAAGVEARLPFLHRPLVEYALGLRQEAVQSPGRPKRALQDAMRGELPAEVVGRRKLAFQDGLGLKDVVARAVADPRRFYAAEYKRRFG